MSAVEFTIAGRPVAKARGLVGRAPLGAGRALWLLRCRSVHTLGINRPLDVVFLGPDGNVLRVVPKLRPRRACVCLRAASVMELEAGGASTAGLVVGAHVDVVSGDSIAVVTPPASKDA